MCDGGDMRFAEAAELRYELLLKRNGTPAAREEDETELELIGKPEGAEGSAQRKAWFGRCQERSDEERRLGPLSVGQRIRVTGDDGLSKRALLMAFDGDDAYEVEYEAGGEAVVPAAKCSALLAFEEAGGAEADAERFKLQGHELFKLRDAAAAIEQYVLGLRALASKATPGARCLIRPPEGTGPLRSAMVLTKDANTVDVSYEADEKISQAGGKDTASRLQALLRQAETISDGSAAAASSPPVPLVSAPQAAPSPLPSWLPSSSWLFSSSEEEAGALKHGGGCGARRRRRKRASAWIEWSWWCMVNSPCCRWHCYSMRPSARFCSSKAALPSPERAAPNVLPRTTHSIHAPPSSIGEPHSSFARARCRPIRHQA